MWMKERNDQHPQESDISLCILGQISHIHNDVSFAFFGSFHCKQWNWQGKALEDEMNKLFK